MIRRHLTTTLYLLMFVVSLLFLSLYLRSFCAVDSAIHFDTQNFFTWRYGGLLGLIPFRDYFYIYGLLIYYAEVNIFVRIVAWIWMALLIVGSSFIIQKITKSRIFALITFVISLIVLQYDTQYWYFLRYGTTVVAILFISYWWSLDKRTMWHIIAGGALTGLVFFLLIDQGTYLFIVSCMLLGIDFIINRHDSRSSLIIRVGQQLGLYVLYGVGCLIGSLPLVFYLRYFGAFKDFFFYFPLTFTMLHTGKVPFFPYGWNVENMWGISVLWIVGFILLYQWFFGRKTFKNVQTYVVIGLWCLLLVFEQKNFMRPVLGRQFMHLIVLLCVLYIHALHEILIRIGLSKRLVSLYIMGILCGLVFVKQQTSYYYYDNSMFERIFRLHWINLMFNESFMKQAKQCVKGNMDDLLYEFSKDTNPVLVWFRNQSGTQTSIFSYPADPMFYLMIGQKPPPFFNGYDASPKSAQERNIEYIETNDIQYFVYNLDGPEVDGVPNILRDNTEIKYLLTRFTPIHRIGNFIIFKKSKVPADGVSALYAWQGGEEIRDMLMKVSLGVIPKTEGTKVGMLSAVVNDNSVSEQFFTNKQNLLQNGPQSSKDLALLISMRSSMIKSPETITLILESEDGLTSSVTYVPCIYPAFCFIHFDRLPHYFAARTVRSIYTNDHVEGLYRLINLNPDQQVFW